MMNNDSSEDFWDLDDDDLEPEAPAKAEDPAPEAPAAPEVESPPEPEEVTPAVQESPEIVHTEKSAPKETAIRKRRFPELTLIEKISMFALFVCLGGAAAWGISTYYAQAPEGPLVTFQEDFPVVGDSVTVSGVETWWRTPVREGENADRGVRIPIKLIPCARIRIEDTNSTLLWVTFRNSDEELVGDPINLLISNGKFESSGSEEITIHSTSGFSNPSEINAYTNGDINPWSVVIVEGGEGKDPNVDSEHLLKVRVEAKVPGENEVD